MNFAVPVGGQAPGWENISSPAWNLFRQRSNAGREPDIHFPRTCKGFEIGLAAEWASVRPRWLGGAACSRAMDLGMWRGGMPRLPKIGSTIS